MPHGPWVGLVCRPCRERPVAAWPADLLLGPRAPGPGPLSQACREPQAPSRHEPRACCPGSPECRPSGARGCPGPSSRRGTKQTANNSWTAGITCAYAIRGATGPKFHPIERQLWVHSRRVVLGGARWQLGQQVWWLYQQTDTRASFVSFSLLQKALFEEAHVGGA
jgi:hypothetical protein